MKALISTTEIFDWGWVSSWNLNEVTQQWEPIYSEITNCQRVAQVELDNNTFPVHTTLFWVDCPDNCVADKWYYKDGQFQEKPQNVLVPEGE
jgi:hypothetical protein